MRDSRNQTSTDTSGPSNSPHKLPIRFEQHRLRSHFLISGSNRFASQSLHSWLLLNIFASRLDLT